MMRRRLSLAAAVAAALLWFSPSADAQGLGGTGGASIPITGGASNNVQIPVPANKAQFPLVLLTPIVGNTQQIYYALGISNAIAASTSTFPLPGGGICVALGPNTWVAAFAAGSTTLNVTQVSGCPIFSGLSPGGGGGGGTVTSVSINLPSSVFSISGSPVTGSGTLTGAFVTQAANTVFAGPTTGAAATPAFRALISADLPIATTLVPGAVQPDGTTITINGSGVIVAALPIGANPTATAGPAAVNGTATTFMRSDAAPAIQKGLSTQFGIVECDNTTITCPGGVLTAAAGAGPFLSLAGGTMAGNIAMGGNNISGGGTITGTQFTSTIASGTPPFIVTSPTVVANLNASSLNGNTFANPGAIGSGTAATSVAVSGLLGTSGAGSAANPEIYVGNTTTGLYSVSTTGFGISVNGVLKGDWGISNSAQWTFITQVNSGNSFSTSATNAFVMGNTGQVVWRNNNTFLSSPATATLQQGTADAASPVPQFFQVQSVVAGTSNAAGVNWTLQGSLSTGSGTSGDIVLKTGGTGAAATVQNAPVVALTVKGATQHFSYGGSAPAVSSCGSGAAIDANANDEAGTVTVGSVATSCTVTFAKAYTTFNHCKVTSQSSISGLAYAYTKTAITVTASVLGGDAFDYVCDGV
jgi:hypothetical protein